MKINDRLYGQIEITEPIILELLSSPSLMRLKHIDQGGYSGSFSPDVISRLEHSIGVYWLLKIYRAPLTEQVAGLIHDVSHSAFSHCIDYILENGDGGQQNHQDNVFNEFVRKSEIPTILEKYDLELDYLLNDDNFPLKERPLPDLCADRIDYFLRTAVMLGRATLEEAQYFLGNLTIQNKQWVFKNIEAAEKYAELFLWMNDNYWASVMSAAMHLSVGDYLSYALQKGYIAYEDLYTTDQEVLDKIQPYIVKDQKLDFFWKRMNNKSGFTEDTANYERVVSLKSRVVDPLFMDQKQIRRLSDVQEEWRDIVFTGLKPKDRFLRFQD
ncbi:MAG: HD domain-containing protein [Patescibacteria group bacterium]|jgi:hypothetical protein